MGEEIEAADGMLNIAATALATNSLGPGRRAVVWVQGCPFSCRGCIAPEWIPFRTQRLVRPGELAAELLRGPAFDGLTLSGGEPMAQAAGLAELVRHVRGEKDVTVVCFTGFTLRRLRRDPPLPGVAELLSVVDVLIDGQYVVARNDGRGLRGSTNQRVHRLTDRLRDCGYDFENRPRSAELRIDERAVTLIGVPPPGLLETLDEVIDGLPGGAR
ncbi:4Fe-4S single cluster domain-containing protein [Nocardia arthritidis]|uniref:4Fe-4S cluster-binding domain-containing protein n=1 Tax=Nocardia arthritidis TaxID=228602 RepID=A0A6G9YBR0_9NOCA|nr:4Fe-4S single cluster domain-containing protein [Nocardia arthritidis]QIS10496.1 4Fe-4S cluster-binding domain-containing protein [Nocardia arthritidis]